MNPYHYRFTAPPAFRAEFIELCEQVREETKAGNVSRETHNALAMALKWIPFIKEAAPQVVRPWRGPEDIA